MPPTIALTSFRQAIEWRARAGFPAAILLCGLALSCSSNSTTITAPSTVKCELSLALASTTMGASGGAGRLVVTTTPECTWSASAEAAWISDLAPASGQGSREIEFRVAANSQPSAREGVVVVNDQRALVRQDAAACGFEIAPDTLDVEADGGSRSVTVTTLAGCAWSAASDADWIVVTPGSGTGAGTLGLEVAANRGAARAGTARVADRVLTVRQGAAVVAPCNVSIAPKFQSFGVAGGVGGPIAVSTRDGCDWTATSSAVWISVTAGRSGSGPGTIAFLVAANSGDGRTGTVAVEGETFVVVQDGVVNCSYTVAPTAQNVAASGGTPPAIQVQTSAPSCAWTATSPVSWITIASGATGAGNGTITYSVAANPDAARSATLTVAGRSVAISQEAAPCSYAIAPTSYRADKDGGEGPPITVTTASRCAWTAASSVSWIRITSGLTGTGPGTVRFRVDRNNGPRREGTLTIGGQTFSVTQEKG